MKARILLPHALPWDPRASISSATVIRRLNSFCMRDTSGGGAYVRKLLIIYTRRSKSRFLDAPADHPTVSRMHRVKQGLRIYRPGEFRTRAARRRRGKRFALRVRAHRGNTVILSASYANAPPLRWICRACMFLSGWCPLAFSLQRRRECTQLFHSRL